MVYVLVPGPFTGPLTWRGVAYALDDDGYGSQIADLRVEPAEGETYWSAHVAAVEASVGAATAEEAVLVLHSGAGPLAPAICERLGTSATAIVFVDAALPHPGRSRLEVLPPALADHLRDLVREGQLPRWSEWFDPAAMEHLMPDADLRAQLVADLPQVRIEVMTEPMPDIDLPDLPTAYVRLSDAYDAEIQTAREQGWPVRALDSTHLGLLTEPEAVARSVLELAAELRR